jgi:sugar phosphate isomerase/epimerase
MNRRDLLKTVPALAACGLSPASAAPAASQARLRTAICAYSYRDALKDKKMTYEDVVRRAVENGIDGVDLTVYWFPGTSDDFLMPLKRFAYRSAVEIYSISISTEMTQSTPELQAKELEKIKMWVDVAAKLGAGHIRVFGGRVPKGATEEQALGWAAEVLKRGAEYSGSKGVILGLENHGGITDKASNVIRIVKQVDSPWAGISLDSGNFRSDGYRQIEMCVPYAVNFQMKSEIMGEDGKRGPSDWDRVVQMAVKGGYQGYLALEYEGREDVATAGPRLLKQLNAVARKYSA